MHPPEALDPTQRAQQPPQTPPPPGQPPFAPPSGTPPPPALSDSTFQVGAPSAPPRRRHRRGLWAGIIAGGVLLVAALVLLAWRLNSAPTFARPPVVTAAASVSVHQLKTGDCLEQMPQGAGVETVTVVECSQYHAAQVYAAETLSGSYGGEGAMTAQVASMCQAKAEPYLGRAKLSEEGAEPSVTYLAPSAQSWARGDRVAYCLIYIPAPGMAGSLMG